MNKINRSLSWILVIAMLLMALPAAAFAEKSVTSGGVGFSAQTKERLLSAAGAASAVYAFEGVDGEITVSDGDTFTVPDAPEVELSVFEYWYDEENDAKLNAGDEVSVELTAAQDGARFEYTAIYSAMPTTKLLTVTKIWNDQDNQDGIRPETIDFIVIGTDDNCYEVTLSGEGNIWTAEVEVEAYCDGEEVEFFVDEEFVTGYWLDDIDYDTLTITNTHAVEMKDLTVKVVWEDNGNQDGIRPECAEITLTGSDGKSYEVTVTGEGSEWNGKLEVEALSAGEEVTFTVAEAEITGYTKSIDNETLTVTNSCAPATKAITVTNVWDDSANQDGCRGAVTLKLTASVDGVELEWSELISASASGDIMDADGQCSLDEFTDDTCSYTFENLPVRYNGAPVAYTLTEVSAPDGYECTIEEYTAYNTYTPALYEDTGMLEITLVWEDKDNRDERRTAVTLMVSASTEDGEITWSDLVEASATGSAMDEDGEIEFEDISENSSTATLKNLPAMYKGKAITYAVSEKEVPAGYSAAVEGFTVTNTHQTEMVLVVITINWDDQGNKYGKRPDDEEVRLYVYADGKLVDAENACFSSGDSIADYYNKYSDDGNLITYTVSERPIDEYDIDVAYTRSESTTSAVITNSYVHGSTVSVVVNQSWRNTETGEAGASMGSVEYTLYANGSAIATRTTAGGSSAVFGNLPKYSTVGTLINYDVSQTGCPDGSRLLHHDVSYDDDGGMWEVNFTNSSAGLIEIIDDPVPLAGANTLNTGLCIE